MARPVYIICCAGVSVDRESNLLSAFTVIENIVAVANPAAKEGAAAESGQAFYVCACWMAEPENGDTSSDQFEHDARMRPPGATEYVRLESNSPPFTFDIEGGKRLQRLIFSLSGGLPIEKSGTLIVEHRIRKVGAVDWLTQDYPVIVQVVDPAHPQPLPATGI